MHYFGIPRHTQSIIAYMHMILTARFWKFQYVIVGTLLIIAQLVKL